jgi:predicted MPP superfamily phosphohydrolase
MLYISRGIGHLLQVRINVRPEVTLFELQPA